MKLSTRTYMGSLWSVNCVLRSTNGFVVYRRSTKVQGSVKGLSNPEACRMNAVRVFVASQCKSMTYVFLQPEVAERLQKERQVLR